MSGMHAIRNRAALLRLRNGPCTSAAHERRTGRNWNARPNRPGVQDKLVQPRFAEPPPQGEPSLAALALADQPPAALVPFTMISLNACVKRAISSAVPIDTRRCSVMGGNGRPTST